MHIARYLVSIMFSLFYATIPFNGLMATLRALYTSFIKTITGITMTSYHPVLNSESKVLQDEGFCYTRNTHRKISVQIRIIMISHKVDLYNATIVMIER